MPECSKNKSGKDFEDKLEKNFHENGKHVKNYNSTVCRVCGEYIVGENYVVCQYPLIDQAGARTKMDFYYKNPSTGKEIFIECKNQKVSGSVDQKLYYYLHQMERGIYGNGSFVLFINDDYKGNLNSLDYFSEEMVQHNSYVIREKNIEELLKLMNDGDGDVSTVKIV